MNNITTDLVSNTTWAALKLMTDICASLQEWPLRSACTRLRAAHALRSNSQFQLRTRSTVENFNITQFVLPNLQHLKIAQRLRVIQRPAKSV